MWKLKKQTKKKLLRDEFEIKKCNIREYHKLAKFHYINAKKPTVTPFTFGLYHNGILYGVIVYTFTSIQLAARSKTPLGKILKRYNNIPRKCRFLNKNVLSIGRVVIHPSVRGIGLGYRLVEDTWRNLKVRFVEGFGFMAYYRNFHPDSYSYYIKVQRTLNPSEYFREKDQKGAMRKRLQTPIARYGYVMYINPDEEIKY